MPTKKSSTSKKSSPAKKTTSAKKAATKKSAAKKAPAKTAKPEAAALPEPETLRDKSVKAAQSGRAPLLTIIIPVYNEELILYGSVEQLIQHMERFDFTYEIIITENGSTDSTVAIAGELADKHAFIRLLHHPEPNYGAALKHGILEARGDYVICDEIDLCDVEFYAKALALLRDGTAQMVVGSKTLAESEDQRPLMRRAATRVLNGLLRYGVGFKGTDTHGLKAFKRQPLLPVVNKCVLEKDLFASEFVIRTQSEGYDYAEVPLLVREMRAPSINLYRRVPKALKDLTRLIYLIRLKG